MHFRKDPFCLFVCAVMSKVLLWQLKKNIYTWFYLAVIEDLKCHTCRYIDINCLSLVASRAIFGDLQCNMSNQYSTEKGAVVLKQLATALSWLIVYK